MFHFQHTRQDSGVSFQGSNESKSTRSNSEMTEAHTDAYWSVSAYQFKRSTAGLARSSDDDRLGLITI